MEEGSNHKKITLEEQTSQDMTPGERLLKELRETPLDYSRAGQTSIMFGIKPPKGWKPSKNKNKSKDQNN
jgi:hypothetical protein